MRRRDFIAVLSGAAVAAALPGLWPCVAREQQRPLLTIGFLHSGSAQDMDMRRAFLQGLAEAGFVERRNVAIEHRWDEDHEERRPALAADLVRRKVAVIVVNTTNFAAVAKAATTTIPIVFLAGGDPIEFGLVASFNRPGGNVTGVAMLDTDIAAKRLGLLHEMLPSASTIAMLVGELPSQFTRAEMNGAQSAARALGVHMLVLNAASGNEIEGAFATLVARQAGALLVSGNAMFGRPGAGDQIISLAARHAIPTMFTGSGLVAAGALSSYGPDRPDGFLQAGRYVGRILKGEKPADLPVVQPTRFEFVINLQTAKRLGLTIPPGVLAIADRVIE
jgi:putative ABC transport system substrate-binding protein